MDEVKTPHLNPVKAPSWDDGMKKEPPISGIPKEIKTPQACRNCSQVFDITETKRVKPGYRFCNFCFGKMEEIGQVYLNYKIEDGQYTLMWEGDPLHIKDRDPVNHMFSTKNKVVPNGF